MPRLAVLVGPVHRDRGGVPRSGDEPGESGNHVVFVDGVRTERLQLPFAYYGTRRIDVLPADDAEGLPDPDHVPTSTTVTLRPPVSPWLFPLDLAGDLLARMFAGNGDRTVAVDVEPAPPAARPAPEIPSAAVGPLHDRALAARRSR